MVRAVIIGVLVLLFAVLGIPAYFTEGGDWWLRATTYSFFHASWWHLAINSLAIWTIYRRPCKPCRDLVIPMLIAIAVYPLALRPVLGFSNVLYAVLGIRTPALSSSWWRRPEVIVFIVVNIALFFFPMFSATTHAASFILGMGCAAISRAYKEFTKDARRYL